MKNTNIFIRVDGNATIGLGHVVRCIALAQMLQDDFVLTFVYKEIPQGSINEITQLGYNLLNIKHEQDLLALLKKDVIVVLDHYGLDSNYQKLIKNTGCKLVCIDDLHDKVFFADLIINHAPNILPSEYKAQHYTQYALGLDYVLLRPVFLKYAKQNIVNKPMETAFVCFGGSDSKNLTQRVVDILKVDKRFKKIIVVVGAEYNYLNNLKTSIINGPNIDLHCAIDSATMALLMNTAGLAVVPSSGILQEVLAVGCKVISGMYVDNQKYVFNNYKTLGAFESAEDFSTPNLLLAINAAFKSKTVIKKHIDGNSKNRLLKAFNQLATLDLAILKTATINDIDKTYYWASNSDIRKFSFNKSTIEYDVHKTWFLSKLDNKNCFYYMAWIGGNEFGSIRFDVKGGEAMISYLVDPAYQNKGLGTVLLKKGVELFLEQVNSRITTIWGEVFYENLASVKIFEKLGYEFKINHSTNIITFKKIIKYTFDKVL